MIVNLFAFSFLLFNKCHKIDTERSLMDNWFDNFIRRFKYKTRAATAWSSWLCASYQYTRRKDAVICFELQWLGAIHIGRFCPLDYRTRHNIRSRFAWPYSFADNWIGRLRESRQRRRSPTTRRAHGGNWANLIIFVFFYLLHLLILWEISVMNKQNI